MRKVLLVDDEVLVRTNIKLMLSPYSDSILICGEAANGAEALSLIEAANPDIVLSDMVMPQMNGVELCDNLKRNFPTISFVALSNYDDFDLVRGTLKNGGTDYLLKHQLNPDTLFQVLSNIELKNTSSANSLSYNEASLITLRNKFVLDLLSNMFPSSEDISYNLQALSIPLDLTKVRMIIMRIDNYTSNIKDNQKKNVIEFSITNIGNEILHQYPTGVLTHLDNAFYAILISFSSVPGEAKINDITNSVIRQLSSNLKTYLNISTSYSIGKICGNIGDISSTYEETRSKLELTFYTGDSSILNESVNAIPSSPLYGLDLNTEQHIYSAVLCANRIQLEEYLSTVFENLSTQKLALNNTQMVFTDLLSLIIRISKENNIAINSIFENNSSPTEQLNQIQNITQANKWFINLFSILCSKIELQNRGDSQYVRKAIAYIHLNYAKSISLQLVADKINISSGYLSKIFKDETGQGFNEYLNSLRISMAAKMIEYDSADLHEISFSCGFQDYAYFFKVFKRKMNMTPTEYKKRCK